MPREADPLLREAFAVMTDLRGRYPDKAAYQRTEARLSNNLANQRLLAGDFADAARLAGVAVRIMKTFADAEAPGPTDRLEVVMYEGTLGQAILGQAKPLDAVALFDDAIRRADALIARDSDINDVRIVRASALHYQARAYQRAHRRDDAWRSADAAVGELERLVGNSPTIHYPGRLAEALLTRASIHHDFGRSLEARNDLERAVGIADDLLKKSPNRPAFSALAGRAWGRLGIADAEALDPNSARTRFDRALKLLAVALESNPDEPDNRKATQEIEEAFRSLPSPSE
jgi:tetratricopeptide (TPR) repeat protein